jgi:hypothetical protein
MEKHIAREDEWTAQHIQVALIQLPCAGEQRDEQTQVEVHGCRACALRTQTAVDLNASSNGARGVPLKSFCLPFALGALRAAVAGGAATSTRFE